MINRSVIKGICSRIEKSVGFREHNASVGVLVAAEELFEEVWLDTQMFCCRNLPRLLEHEGTETVIGLDISLASFTLG
jgi:hypothetical protein